MAGMMGLLVFVPLAPLPPGKEVRHPCFQRLMILAHLHIGLQSELKQALIQREVSSEMEPEMGLLVVDLPYVLPSS
jgi:hypothetical protein